jgi:ATP-dependent protease ClpP protease subunit
MRRDIAIHAKEILRVREKLNQIYVNHLTKSHTLQEIGMLDSGGGDPEISSSY